MKSRTRLTVVFGTCNRAPILSDTLEYMCQVDKSGLEVNFVIVDNNSVDETRTVVESYRDRLSIRYLLEPRKGKNRALNLALQHGGFHPLVVFTDDDVKPAADWLQAIVEVTRRWPGHHVFGGRIVPTWPVANPPAWVHDSHIRQLAFAAHDMGEEKPYEPTVQPFGPNFWCRREVLTPDVRFDESVGPGTGTLGDEVMFLHTLQKRGYEIIHSPASCVEHRIQPEGICVKKLEQRALMVGRIGPNMYGLCSPETLSRAPSLWRLLRYIRLNQARIGLLRARLHRDTHQRIVRSIGPLIDIGYNEESLRLARGRSVRRMTAA